MIESKSVSLRTIRSSDLDALLQKLSRFEENGEFWPIKRHSEVAFRKRFEETGMWGEDQGSLLIVDKEENLLGFIGFFRKLDYVEGYELGGKIFRERDRGRGIMAEALRVFSAYLFELKPIPRLYATAIAGNEASRKVLEKNGFRHEGTMRQAIFQRGKLQDLHFFSLLRQDAPPLREALKE